MKYNNLTKSQIVDLLKETDEKVVRDLLLEADRVRHECVGDEVHLRGLIEFSNVCRRNCLFCGLRKSNRKRDRYRMTIKEILETACEARDMGFKTIVLQSGEADTYPIEALSGLVRDIKSEAGVAITLSIGEHAYDDYKRLREAGADRYLLRFETSDRELFKRLKPDSDYDQRFQCLSWLRDLGYQVGSGIMVGLPGQTPESIADDILLFNDLDLDMIGLGPFISNPDTPLAGADNGSLDQVLRVTALTRIVTRNTHIPATTATGTIDPEGRQKALQFGANVLMPNLTPLKYKKNYLLYPDKICIDEDGAKCRFCTEGMVQGIGRTISPDEGHSLKDSHGTGK